MVKTNIYEVAGHRFAVTAEDDLLQKMDQYGPFLVQEGKTEGLVFWLKVVEEREFPSTEGKTEESVQEEGIEKIVIGHVGQQPYFEFWSRDSCKGRMLVDVNWQEVVLTDPDHTLYALNNAAMLMYAMATSRKKTALFHSSVVEHQGRAYMFLGKSGTGKSTHSQLWIKYIPETQLVNDDNPVVRVFDDGTATVYGSPWSGKTPCYRNVSYPIGGVVKLEQAPLNRIRRLSGVEAYAEVVPSISGKRWDKALADGLHETENALIKNVPMWHLDCLPDEEAARLCFGNINNK
jgi:hypothetical protein